MKVLVLVLFMLTGKYAIDSYEMLVPLPVEWAIDSHTWQSTHLHQTKLLSEIAIVFFLYIRASDLLCNVTLLSGGGPGSRRTPFRSLSLSFWLCLNQSIYFQIASWVQEQGLLSLLGWNIKSMHTPIYRVGFNFYLILMGIKLALSVVKDILFQIQGPLYSWRRESDGEWMCWINADLRKLGGVGQALRHWPVVILHLLPWGE